MSYRVFLQLHKERMDVKVGLWRGLSAEELMLLNCGVREDSWESLGTARRSNQSIQRISVLGVHWKDGCWNWNSNTLATWSEELTHLKRSWCWERLRAGGEGDDRGWDGWMASRLNGRESEWTPGVGDGQGGLVCCNSLGHKESDTTERLNWDINYTSEKFHYKIILCNEIKQN